MPRCLWKMKRHLRDARNRTGVPKPNRWEEPPVPSYHVVSPNGKVQKVGRPKARTLPARAGPGLGGFRRIRGHRLIPMLQTALRRAIGPEVSMPERALATG